MPGWRTPSPNAALELQVCHLCTLCSRWRLLAIRNVPHPREKTRIERNRYAVPTSPLSAVELAKLPSYYDDLGGIRSCLMFLVVLEIREKRHTKWTGSPKGNGDTVAFRKNKQHLVNDSIRIAVPSTNDSRCRGWHARFTFHCQSVTYQYIVQGDGKVPKSRHVHWDCISYGSSAHTNSKMWYRVACVGGSHLFTITSPSLSRSASLDPLLKILWVFRIESEG